MSKQLIVDDMQGDNFCFVQDLSEITDFNKQFDEEYSYYFIEFKNGSAIKIFGADGVKTYNNVYFVSNL